MEGLRFRRQYLGTGRQFELSRNHAPFQGEASSTRQEEEARKTGGRGEEEEGQEAKTFEITAQADNNNDTKNCL